MCSMYVRKIYNAHDPRETRDDADRAKSILATRAAAGRGIETRYMYVGRRSCWSLHARACAYQSFCEEFITRGHKNPPPQHNILYAKAVYI